MALDALALSGFIGGGRSIQRCDCSPNGAPRTQFPDAPLRALNLFCERNVGLL